MSRLRLFLEWLVILACTVGIALWALREQATDRLDYPVLDHAAAQRASAPADDILLVGIDDRSLASLGSWPWDRRIMAHLVDNLDARGARIIVLDVLFTEPSDPQADRALAEAIARAGNVALPHAFAPARDSTHGADVIPPIAALASAAIAQGHVGVDPDRDGAVRRVPLALEWDGARYPHLMLGVMALDGQRRPFAHGLAPALPLRPAGAYRTVSADAVVRGEVPPGFIDGKIVLVGATATGLGDTLPVPWSAGSAMSGVELQANVLQALREDSFITPIARQGALALTLLPLAALFLGFWRLPPAQCLALALGLVVALVGGAYALALYRGLWFTPGPAILAIIIAYPLWGWRRLAAVSGYLDRQAARLAPASESPGQCGAGGFDSIARQVTRLSGLVDEMAERRSFLQRVVDAAPDAICVFRKDDTLMLMNARARAIFGAEDGAVSFADLVVASGASLVNNGAELALPDGRSFALARSNALPGLAPDGEQGDERGGSLQGFSIVTLAETTGIRRAEEERRRMLEFLSHDMRSPQVAILGLLAGRGTAQPLEDRLGRIERHARRTLELADAFVQLARLAEVPLAAEPVDIAALADEAVDRAYAVAQIKGITLKQESGDDPVFALADASVIARVLDNLVGNAVRYCPAGSTVTVAVEQLGDGRASVMVADDGPGLPPARLDNPFARFGTSGAPDGSGAGLGLAFVHSALEKHGGSVSCRSVPGGGVRFTILLPGA